MSIDIDWDSLTTGPSGDALAESVRDFIHAKFQQIQLPRFIRSVHIHTFQFGKECPTVELKDISDPLPEFYEDDGSSEDEENEEESDEGEGRGASLQGQTEANKGMPPPSMLPQRNEMQDRLSMNKKSDPPRMQPPGRTARPFPDAINPSFLPHSTTPGIPGGASNLSYFHLPLSAGLSRAATPLGSAGVTPFAPPAQWTDHFRPPSPTRAHPARDLLPAFNAYADPSSRPSTAYSHPGSPTPAQNPFQHNPSLAQGDEIVEEDRSQDLQTTLHISYDGTLSLSLTAEILLDYPMPSFVGIPLKLQITGLNFDGVALLAYLRGSSSPSADSPDLRRQSMTSTTSTNAEEHKQSQIKFCFLGPEDARALLDSAIRGQTTVAGDIPTDTNTEDTQAAGGLLREIRVESEVGRQENGKQVLKNVGKIEKFVVEQMRKIFEEEFVWPSFWSFLV